LFECYREENNNASDIQQKKVILILVGTAPFSPLQKLTLELEPLQTGLKKIRLLDPFSYLPNGL
jgi:hypothetical protein